MAKRRKKLPVPNAIFFVNPKTGRRKRWRSGPVPKNKDGTQVRLFDSRGRKVRKLPKRNKRTAKLATTRLPSADPTSIENRRAIVRLAKAKTWQLFWLVAGVVKPGENQIIFIGTKVFVKPINTRIANAMLRDVSRRATKSGEAILFIDLIRRQSFEKSKKRKSNKKKRK